VSLPRRLFTRRRGVRPPMPECGRVRLQRDAAPRLKEANMTSTQITSRITVARSNACARPQVKVTQRPGTETPTAEIGVGPESCRSGSRGVRAANGELAANIQRKESTPSRSSEGPLPGVVPATNCTT